MLARGLLALTLTATLAQAKVPLRDEAHVNGQLLAAQIGDILRKTCPDASARFFVVHAKINALKAYARAKGYTEDEVKAFLRNRDDKARIRGLAEGYLAGAGAVKGDVESYCRVARDEVRRGTVTGEMLRVVE